MIGFLASMAVVAIAVAIPVVVGEKERRDRVAPDQIVPWRLLGVSADRRSLVVQSNATYGDCEEMDAAAQGDAEDLQSVTVVVEDGGCKARSLVGIRGGSITVELPGGQRLAGAEITGPRFEGTGQVETYGIDPPRPFDVAGLRLVDAKAILEANRLPFRVAPGGPANGWVTRQDPSVEGRSLSRARAGTTTLTVVARRTR